MHIFVFLSRGIHKAVESGYNALVPEQNLLTKAELMEYLRISRGTVDKLMKKHELPFIKLEKKVLFRLKDVDRWLESKLIK
jgi:excisionase family DNA binding protein